MVTRRDMIRQVALVGGGLCICSRINADNGKKSGCCFTPDVEPEAVVFRRDAIIIDLEKSYLLREVGDAVYVDTPDKTDRIILIHESLSEYLALSRLCTHGGQALSYIKERKVLQCNSYNHSIFELNGAVWKGPAPVPIRLYSLQQKGDSLEIYI